MRCKKVKIQKLLLENANCQSLVLSIRAIGG